MKLYIKKLFREGLIREELSDDEMNQLKELIKSGQADNIELAFMIASGHGEDVENALFTYWYNSIRGTNLTWDELKNKRRLDLYNKLTTLPESIGNLTNLEQLWLSLSKLTTLPENIGNLKKLGELWLYNNNLTSLPESIGNLTNLTYLGLYSNKLASLPDSIGNLKNLGRLGLSFNQLTTLPESIGKLKNLYRLYLQANPISDEEKVRIKKLLPNTKISF